MSKIVARYVGGGIYEGLPARDLTAADLVEYKSIIEALGGQDVITAPGAPYQRAEEQPTRKAARREYAAEEETA